MKDQNYPYCITMPSFCEYRNCHRLASSTYIGFCTKDHMNRGIADDPNWYHTSSMKDLFEIFEMKDKKRLEPKVKPREISKLQVRPLVKESHEK